MVKLLKNIWDILIHGYDARTTIIVDGSKEKDGYNAEVSCSNNKSLYLPQCQRDILVRLIKALLDAP